MLSRRSAYNLELLIMLGLVKETKRKKNPGNVLVTFLAEWLQLYPYYTATTVYFPACKNDIQLARNIYNRYNINELSIIQNRITFSCSQTRKKILQKSLNKEKKHIVSTFQFSIYKIIMHHGYYYYYYLSLSPAITKIWYKFKH